MAQVGVVYHCSQHPRCEGPKFKGCADLACPAKEVGWCDNEFCNEPCPFCVSDDETAAGETVQ